MSTPAENTVNEKAREQRVRRLVKFEALNPVLLPLTTDREKEAERRASQAFFDLFKTADGYCLIESRGSIGRSDRLIFCDAHLENIEDWLG